MNFTFKSTRLVCEAVACFQYRFDGFMSKLWPLSSSEFGTSIRIAIPPLETMKAENIQLME